MNVLWVVLLTITAGFAFGFLIYGLRRWPVVGSGFAAIAVLIAWELPQMPAMFSVGGNNVYLLDVMAAAFLTVGMSRTELLRRNLGAASWFWWALGALILISLLRGLPEFGLGSATNEFRQFLYPFAALTWTMSLPRSENHPAALVGRYSVWLGWGLVAVSAFHIAKYGLGSAAELIDSGSGIVQTTRPLVSGQALMLLMCAAVCLWLWRSERRRSYMFHAAIFGVVVLVVQQRTVWSVATMAIIAVLAISRVRTKATVLAWLAAAGILLPFLFMSSTVQDFASQLQSAAENSSTYDARSVSWQNLISQSVDGGEERVIFGAPMGTGFGRLEGIDRWVTFAPHNWYLTLYLRVGVVGLLLFAAFIVTTFVTAVRRRADMASIAIIVVMAGYGWSYSWLWYSAVFAGWAYSKPGPTLGPDMKTRLGDRRLKQQRGTQVELYKQPITKTEAIRGTGDQR